MRFLRKLIRILILIILILSSILIYRGYEFYKETIKESTFSDKVLEIKSNKNYTYYSELPQNYINAVVSVEDRRFFKHNGIDIISVGRAFVTNIKDKKLKEGGSTITQQLVKNVFYNQDKSVTRKIAEIITAFKFEKMYSKEEIFELYVNTCYFGDGYYCVKDAAQGYFGKNPIDMDLYECSLLAGIPNAPSVYAPTKNPELAKERQQQVLKKMVNNKYITQDEADSVANKEYDYNNE